MFSTIKIDTGDITAEYHEETVKVPAAITVVLVLLISIPLGTWIYRIDAAGKVSANVSKYEALVETVNLDVQTINAVLNSDEQAMAAIQEARRAGSVRLIVPEVVIVEKRDTGSKTASTLNINMDGIYWSPDNPLVTVDGETYRIGDTIQGHTIIAIGKRSVTFESPGGKTITKDIYEDLLQRR